jgi:segregation and condensation protein A
MLQQKRLIEDATWSNPQIEQFLSEDEGPGLAVTIFDLVKTLTRTCWTAPRAARSTKSGRRMVSVPDMIHFLRQQLTRMRRQGALSATQLFESQRSRRAMICLFLAILELVKRQSVSLTQGEAFGDIGLERGPSFEENPESLADLETVEQDYR